MVKVELPGVKIKRAKLNLKIVAMKAIKNEPFVSAEEIAWEQLDNGMERKIIGYDDQVMMVCVRFRKDAIGSLHHHIHRQISYVQAGSFQVTIDGRVKVLNQGDCFFVAPGLIHGVVALEDGVLVDVFTPARMDFLS